MKICVVGLGYIGLPTAAMFASKGNKVLGVDINEKIIKIINNGKIHIEEPGLASIVNKTVKQGYLKASLNPEKADVFIIAVPTPNKNDNFFSCDLTHVLAATRKIIPYLDRGNLVIIESTIAPRTTEDYIKPLLENAGFKIGKDLYLVHCPERVLPGKILWELENNNRIVGGITSICADKASKVYQTFVKGKIIKTEAKTAEMSKLMENTFRDINIALANELTKICYELEINVLDVIKMANMHPRVNIHQPGPGVGGHCIAIDPYFIYAKAPETTKMIKLARDINNNMPAFVVEHTERILNNKQAKIAIFGITYKGNVDDIRKSPALEIIKLLKEKSYSIGIYDPHVKNMDCLSFEEALRDAEILLILADHNEFKNMDYDKIKKLMKKVIIFDTKSIISKDNSNNIRILNYGNLYLTK